MLRRDFLKVLAGIGAVAIASPILSNIPKVDIYPNITHSVQFSFDKQCYLHTISGRDFKGDTWDVAEYSFEKHLDEKEFNHMVDVLTKQLTT